MDNLPAISLALALSGLFGTWLISHDVQLGWLYMTLYQLPCTVYDIWTRQYGYLILLPMSGWVYFQGWRRRKQR